MILQCHVILDPMHGGAFNGNGFRTLTKKVDALQALAPIVAQPFTEAFRALDKVVASCFERTLIVHLWTIYSVPNLSTWT